MPTLSLILPVYNQADHIEPVFHKLYQTIQKTRIDCELILVENGSKDASLEIIKKIAKKYPHTIAITTKKGYGSAVLAGQKIAKGYFIGHMPSDGQVDPEIVPILLQLIQQEGYDLVKV